MYSYPPTKRVSYIHLFSSRYRAMLELGKEKTWMEALKTLTGSTKLSSKPIIDYFKPFEDWLDEHREKNGYKLGWEDEDAADVL